MLRFAGPNEPKKPIISHVNIIGDSLSDSGTAQKRVLFYCIPMALLSGLSANSPLGRFTNGYAWSDNLGAKFMNDSIIRNAINALNKTSRMKKLRDATDIADAIITSSFEYKPQRKIKQREYQRAADISDDVITNHHFQDQIRQSYTLDNNLFVQYRGRRYIRSYDEGGLTSHDYSWAPSYNIKRFFTRLVLSTLKQKSKLLLKDDKKTGLSAGQKKRTLIIEWSGANDLVTANAKPSFKEADKAVKARIKNVEKLMENGYSQFMLFNLPDLSLTPSFQNLTGKSGEKARANAHTVVEYFNQQLILKAEAFRKKYPAVTVNIFDVHALFDDIIDDIRNQTHRYPGGFEKEKLNIPFTESKDMVIENKLSPADGYSFWDKQHPIADMHAVFAEKIYDKVTQLYLFRKPRAETYDSLCQDFKRKYKKVSEANQHTFFSKTPTLPPINYSDPKIALSTIFQASTDDKKLFNMLKELQWITMDGKINVAIPTLGDLVRTNEALFLKSLRP